ncbi:Uncharacterised protein [Mycobacteroides abscessus subsp. abscessus]|nr:Uncharacterised protein [Mycobacteroides abscessus subsp. abscessus]
MPDERGRQLDRGQVAAETDAERVDPDPGESRDVVTGRGRGEILADADREQNLAAGEPFVDFRQLGGVDDRHLLLPRARRIDGDLEGEFAPRPQLSQGDHAPILSTVSMLGGCTVRSGYL